MLKSIVTARPEVLLDQNCYDEFYNRADLMRDMFCRTHSPRSLWSRLLAFLRCL